MADMDTWVQAIGRPYRFRVKAYHRMVDVGILDEDDHVELLEGLIIEKPPLSADRAHVITELNRLLVLGIGESFEVRPRLPLTLDEQSEPEPELAVVSTDAAPSNAHPHHALLVVEVTTASLIQCLREKARLYARASIPEYWLVDADRKCIEVYREPDAAQGLYRSREMRSGGEVIECRALAGVSLPLSKIFS